MNVLLSIMKVLICPNEYSIGYNECSIYHDKSPICLIEYCIGHYECSIGHSKSSVFVFNYLISIAVTFIFRSKIHLPNVKLIFT